MDKIFQPKPLENHKGFTLIEVLITLSVLAIGLAGIATFLVTNCRYVRTANESTTSAIIANAKMEDLFNKGYSAPDLNVADATAPHTDSVAPIYNLAWTVTLENSLSATPAKLIKLTVSWPSKGETRTFVLNSIISKNT